MRSNKKRDNMKKTVFGVAAVALLALTQACSTNPALAPDVTTGIKDALKAAGFNDISVSQDRDKGVVTLKGNVATELEKKRAESVAKPLAAGQVLGNEIAILPLGSESAAKTLNSDIDDGIKKNLDAALIENHMREQVKYDVKAGVITLTGEVTSQALRGEAQRVAMGVPNVQQVINKLDVKNQKASSSK